VVDMLYTGLDGDWALDDLFKNPRGIRGYELLGGGDFDTWKIAGNYGGEDYPDRVRGGLNEGGLWAEREGAVLPGYKDDSVGGVACYITTIIISDGSLYLVEDGNAVHRNRQGWHIGLPHLIQAGPTVEC
jgi:hypothetical protein